MTDRQPSTDDEIAAFTVGGEPVRVDGAIHLDEYDPAWPEIYATEAERVREVLGDRVLVLEHVGSTSVPGLAAKPIIDMVLGLADSANEDAYVPDMEAAGYVLRIREPDWHEHRLFKGPEADINLHVFTAGDSEIDRMIGFRDNLRAHPEDFELYLGEKRRLAAKTWAYVQNYADAKSEVIDRTIHRRRGTREGNSG